jgi:hypothetical protein
MQITLSTVLSITNESILMSVCGKPLIHLVTAHYMIESIATIHAIQATYLREASIWSRCRFIRPDLNGGCKKCLHSPSTNGVLSGYYSNNSLVGWWKMCVHDCWVVFCFLLQPRANGLTNIPDSVVLIVSLVFHLTENSLSVGLLHRTSCSATQDFIANRSHNLHLLATDLQVHNPFLFRHGFGRNKSNVIQHIRRAVRHFEPRSVDQIQSLRVDAAIETWQKLEDLLS